MAEIASAYVSLLPSMKGFGSSVAAQGGSEVGKAGGFLGGLLGKGMLAGFAAVGVAAGVAKGLYEVGQTFDDLSDTIRIKTGESGQALEQLQGIAEQVGKNVPVAFDQIGPVVADLNRRLDLTGKPLEKLSEQFLQLGHITGEQIDIPTVTGALNAFSVKASQSGKVLDTLFQVTQSTGISFSDLASTLQSNGPTLSQFGLSVKQSAVLIGNLDKAGIDSSRTLASMRTALANFAKAGKDPEKALLGTIDQIGRFVKKGDEAGAVNVAAKVFGTRGASQFVAAVRSGRLNVDQLTKATTGSRDTIQKAAADTADFSEKWQQFKNRVLVKLEPVATKVFNAIGQAGTKLGPGLHALMVGFRTQVIPAVQQAAAIFEQRVLPVLQGQVLPVLQRLASFLVTTVGPAFMQYMGIIRTQVIPTLASLAQWFGTKILPIIADTAAVVAHNLAPVFAQAGVTLQTKVLPALSKALSTFEKYRPTIQKVVEILAKLIAHNIKLTSAILGKVLPVVIRLAAFFAGKVVVAIGAFISSIVHGIAAVIDFGRHLVAAVQSATQFAKGVIDKSQRVLEFFRKLPGKITGFLKNLPGELAKIGGQIIDGLVRGIKAAAHKVEDAVNAIINKIPKFIRDKLGIHSPSKVTEALGRAIGDGLAKGIADSSDTVGKATEKLSKKVKEKLANLRDSLASIRSDFASLVDPIASNFTQGLFDFDTASAFTANLATVKGTLTTLIGNFKKLIGEGLSPGFLYQLFQSGGPGLINSLAGLSAAEAQQAGALFGDVQSLSQTLGTAVAGQTDHGAALLAEQRKTNDKIEKLIKSGEKNAERIAEAVTQPAKRARRRAVLAT